MPAKILIVEDDPDSLEILSNQLRHLGYDVREAENANVGETKALSENPDLIIMDLGLPGMNGIEAAARLKQNPQTAHIPIVAYTVWDKELYEKEARRAGIAAYLTKPTPSQVFKQVVEQLLQDRS